MAIALLIRAGGATVLSSQEWEDAIEHDGTIFISRELGKPGVEVYLMRKSTATA